MRLVQTVQLECRLCGAGMERPLRAGLCARCATLRLTDRQVEVLRVYADPDRPARACPTALKEWIAAAPTEQAHGMRIAAAQRVVRALEDKFLMRTDGSAYVLMGATLTERGRALTKRLREEV